jgi:hypothetical protein
MGLLYSPPADITAEDPMADEREAEAQMDADALYQEEMFTDRRVGALRRLTPVKRDGSKDEARPCCSWARRRS